MYFYLEGRVPSKKNSKQIIRVNGRPVVISSKNYLVWEKWAVLELRSQANKLGLDKPFKECDIVVGLTFPDKRKTDLSNKFEGISDALIKAGIIVDDCWQVVRSINVFVYDDKKPGARIEVIPRSYSEQ